MVRLGKLTRFAAFLRDKFETQAIAVCCILQIDCRYSGYDMMDESDSDLMNGIDIWTFDRLHPSSSA